MHLSKLIQQKEHETIEIVLRRHPLTFLPAIFIFILMHLIAIGAYMLLSSYFPTLLETEVSRTVILMMISIFLLTAWLIFYSQFVDYYLDVWIITNKRIVNVEQHGLFGRTISELELFQVQDVTSEVIGFIPSIFRYGYVHIQTAGEKNRFVFEQIPNAHAVRKTILDLVTTARKTHSGEMLADEIL